MVTPQLPAFGTARGERLWLSSGLRFALLRRRVNGQEVQTRAARSAAGLPSTSVRPNPSPELPLSGRLTPSKNSYTGVEHGRNEVLALHKPQGFDLWSCHSADEIHPPAFFNIVSWQLSWFLC